MFKLINKKMQNTSTESKLFYDDADALEFIFNETGVDKKTIRQIMNADLRYQKSVGIIDWEDLDEYIAYWTKNMNNLYKNLELDKITTPFLFSLNKHVPL